MVTAQEAQVLKVGQLAAATGLTVRALHHYDHLGLVRPSARTAAGYRLYVKADVERLYQVLALRQLGFPLDEIGEVLDGTSSIHALLAEHRAYLDRQLVAIRTLRAQLTTLAAAQDGEATSVTDFVELIREVITVDDTVKRYFSDQQLADLAERRAWLGEAVIADIQAAWPKLIGRVQAAVDAGVAPVSPQAQKMAAEWTGLLGQFHGNDEGLRGSLYRIYAENSQQIEQRHGGPSAALLEFIQAAIAAGH
ncbi:MAG: MerR family transcriptional regulator [Acidimicrobiales bacterium]